jgi:primary-amine oxidase
VVKESAGLDANPFDHRVFKIINSSKKNPHSGNPVAYKFTPLPTQKILAAPGSIQAQRALFTNHHVWVTKYRDDELYAAGPYTLQSQIEQGGVHDMVARKDNIVDEDLVVWNTFGLTHNPRVEDWPVMPVEIYQVHFKPSELVSKDKDCCSGKL